jgi:tRNA-dihydrouridine synthase A
MQQQHFRAFIDAMHETAGIRHFVVHARKAVIGWRPSKNRAAPTLQYDYVYRLKQEMPHLRVE